MICLMSQPRQNFFDSHVQSKENFLQKKSFLKKIGGGGLNKKQKEGFLATLAMVIKKDLTTSIR